eukprot:TRINITY_DN76930_c0_g1_i1.p2 TRINITY_DN76930_c0_g1~~TRINITY_DN76930_c0_g1_i1.p2  ORF type:complete len:152 (+),score=64.10 TRINITY_DN76930_c0_g1_i1:128-583(+)
MELMSTIATLDSHFLVLDSELKEINHDMVYLKELTKRYGKHWEKAAKQLKILKSAKEHARKEVQMSLDLFRLHLPQAKALCKKLRRNGSNLVVERAAKDAPDFVLTVDSPILSHSQNVSPSLESDPRMSTVTLYRMQEDPEQPKHLSPPSR